MSLMIPTLSGAEAWQFTEPQAARDSVLCGPLALQCLWFKPDSDRFREMGDEGNGIMLFKPEMDIDSPKSKTQGPPPISVFSLEGTVLFPCSQDEKPV